MRSVRDWASLYAAFFRISLLANLQYRASGTIWMIGLVLEPLVFLVVWSTVARSEGGAVAGLDPRDLAAYYIALLVVNHLTFSWIMHTFEYRVRFGELGFELLRPLHPIHGDICDNVAYKLVMLIVLLPAVAVLTWLFEPRFAPDPGALALLVPALVLGLAVRLLLDWTLALAAFWTTRVTAINQTYFAIVLFLSGRVAPIALLPGWLQDVAGTLPFYWTVAFPAELATGRVGFAAGLRGLAVQLVWVLAALGLISFGWRRSLRRFTAVGT